MRAFRMVGPVLLIGVVACSPKGGGPGATGTQPPPAEQPAGSGPSGADGGSGSGTGAGGGSTAGPGSAPGPISTTDPRAGALQRALRHRYAQ